MKFKLIDLFKRKTKFSKKEGIIFNGIDNDYPEITDRLFNLSVTAKMASTIMTNYVYGKGFKDGDFNVYKDISLNLFTQYLSKCIVKHRGTFVHINWNANFTIENFRVLPYHTCRLGKKDDKDYNGKILVTKDWQVETFGKKDINVIDVFNPDKSVILAQVGNVKADSVEAQWRGYKGQIWYFNPDIEYEYSLSRIDAVTKDCDSESQASVFKNRSLRKGFFGKTMIITKPMTGKLSEDYGNDEKLYHQALAEEEEFQKTAKDWLGAENSGNIMHIQLEHNGDNFDEAIKIEQFKSDINDKLFEYTENSVFKNILMSFNNMHAGMVRTETALLGNSGEMLRVMKETYLENVVIEIAHVEMIVNRLMFLFKDKLENLELIPLVEVKEINKENDSIDKQNGHSTVSQHSENGIGRSA